MKINSKTLSNNLYLLIIGFFAFSATYAQGLPIPLINTLAEPSTEWEPAIYSLAFDSKSRLLVGSDRKNLKIWDVPTARVSKILTGHSTIKITGAWTATLTSQANDLKFSPDGKLLASAGIDGNIIIWDVKSANKIYILNDGGRVNCIAFHPEGKILVSGASIDPFVRLWSMQNGSEIQKFELGECGSITFSHDGKTVAIGTGGYTNSIYIRLFDFQTKQTFQNIFVANNAYSLIFTIDDRILISGSRGDINLWDPKTGKGLKNLIRGEYRDLALSHDGKTLAGGTEKFIYIWNVDDWRLLSVIEAHTGKINSVVFSPSGTMLASGSDDGSIKLWDVSLLDPELRRIYFSNQQQKTAEIQNLNSLSKPKDEFETDQEYKARLNKAKAEQKAIEDKFALKYNELKKAYYEQKEAQLQQAEQETQAKIRASLSEAILTISNLGTYDANTETFPITINEKTQSVKMPRSEARSFKEKWRYVQVRGMKQLKKDLATYEYFNLMIIHPETGNQYPFGEQRDLTQVSAVAPAAASGASKAVTPPALNLAAKLIEPSGNGFLDAEEKGRIVVEVGNSGQGPAFGVIVDLLNQGNDPAVTFSRTRVAGEIPAGQTKTLEFEVQAAKSVQRKQQQFLIKASESNGFVPNPAQLNFETYPLLLPEISLVDYGITTASGDNVITPGEVVYVKVRLQNVGQGSARNLKLNFNLPPNVFFAPGSRQTYEIAELPAGEFTDLDFSILANPQAGSEAALTIGMTEANTQGSFPLTLAIDKPLQTVQQFFTRGEEQRKEIKGAPGLTVDIAKDIPVVLKKNPDAVAVVIGNRDYQKAASVDYAVNDAQLVKQYLIQTFGFREENIIFEKNATQGTFSAIFGTEAEYRGKLYNFVKANQSEVFVYYSGHGVPDPESQKAYFVPVDCDPSFAKLNGYSLDLFYTNLTKLPAKSITVVIDACFSGTSEKGNLLSNISPALLVVENPLRQLPNSLVMTSAAKNQVSSWYPEKKHSLFTYFFLKGIKGEADQNSDARISFGELQGYVNQNVPYLARRLNNREQTPEFAGDKSSILIEPK